MRILVFTLVVAASAYGQGVTMDKNAYTPIRFHVNTVETVDVTDGQEILVSGSADVDGHFTSYQLSCNQRLAHDTYSNNFVCKQLRAGHDYPAKLYDQYGACLDFWEWNVPPKGQRIRYLLYGIDSAY